MRKIVFWFADGNKLEFELIDTIELQVNKGLLHKQIIIRNSDLAHTAGLEKISSDVNSKIAAKVFVDKIVCYKDQTAIVTCDKVTVESVEYRIISVQTTGEYEEVAILF